MTDIGGSDRLHWTKFRKRIAIITVIATIFGIYLNASFNYNILLLNRARAASDVVLLIGRNAEEILMDSGKQCIKYATENLSNDQIKSAWGQGEHFSLPEFPNKSKEAYLDLKRCLSNFNKNFDASDDINSRFFFENINNKSEVGLIEISQFFHKKIFSYMNTFEIGIMMWKNNQVDHNLLCEQISNLGEQNRPLTQFLSMSGGPNSKLNLDNRDKVKEYYPALYWYYEVDVKEKCKSEFDKWLRNYISPVVPFLSS